MIIALLAIMLLGAASPPGRIALATAGLLLHVLHGVPVSPLALMTRAPVIEQVQVVAGGASRVVDLYRPTDTGPHAAVIFSLGLHPDYHDATLVQLADALARQGIVVAIPHSPALDENRLDPGDIDALVGVFQLMQQRDDVSPDRVGFAGFCIGSSLATIAAGDTRIMDRVAFLHLFGGYDDLHELVVSITSRTVVDRGARVSWEPGELVFAVLTQHLVQSLSDPADTALLTKLFSEDRPTSAYVEGLSSQGRTVYGLLMSQDVDGTERLLSQLPQRDQDMLQRLSPSNANGHISARVFMMSDVNDPIIPVAQTRQLAEQLSAQTSTSYTEFTMFHHVQPEQQIEWSSFVSEVSRLYFHLYRVLAEIEGL